MKLCSVLSSMICVSVYICSIIKKLFSHILYGVTRIIEIKLEIYNYSLDTQHSH